MLSKDSVRYLKLTLNIGSRIFSHPLIWNEETQSVTVRQDRLWVWKCTAAMQIAYMIFTFTRFVEAFMIQGKPLHKCILIIYYFLSHFYFNTIQQNFHFSRNEVASFITKFIQFDTACSTEDKNGTTRDKVGKLFKFVFCLGYSHAGFQGILFFYFSDNKAFIYSAFKGYPGFELFPVKLVFALFEVFYYTETWSMTLMNTFVLFAVLENITVWNQHVSLKDSWSHEKHKYYNCLNIVVSRFNECFGTIVFPGGQIGVLFQATICLYGTIRFYGVFPLAAYLVMPTSCVIMVIYTSVVYRFSGRLHESTHAVIQAWKMNIISDSKKSEGSGRSKAITLEQKYLNSCPPLGIKVSGFYFIKLGTIVTYCSIMVSNTINLLLA